MCILPSEAFSFTKEKQKEGRAFGGMEMGVTATGAHEKWKPSRNTPLPAPLFHLYLFVHRRAVKKKSPSAALPFTGKELRRAVGAPQSRAEQQRIFGNGFSLGRRFAEFPSADPSRRNVLGGCAQVGAEGSGPLLSTSERTNDR